MIPPRVLFSATIAVALTAIIAVQQVRVGHLQKEIDSVQEQHWQQRVDSVRVITDTVAVQMASAVKVVTKMVETVRVDTFIVHPKTSADTTHAVTQLGTLVIQHDSLQRECTDLAGKCTKLEAAMQGERAATKTQVDGLKRQLKERRKRSWVGTPDLVMGVGECATADGLRGCLFAGVGARIGW